eukprot:m.153487 g.153487  ORF g.153487 m.153487 type:complete len:330 (-) comp16234_c0_seq2:1591-2580(-)
MFSFTRGLSAEPTQPEADGHEQQPEKKGTFMSSFFTTMQDLGSHLKQGVNQVTSVAFADFDREHEKFLREKHQKMAGAAVPPWVGCDDEDELKNKILALSQDERNFTRDPPPGAQFHFDFDQSFPVAEAIIVEDPRLEGLRFRLVPKAISEHDFWRNYFYRVELIKQSSNMTQMSPPSTSTSAKSERPTSASTNTSAPVTRTSTQESSTPEEAKRVPDGKTEATSATQPAENSEEVDLIKLDASVDDTNPHKDIQQQGVPKSEPSSKPEQPETVFDKEGWEDTLRDEFNSLEMADEFDEDLAGLDLEDDVTADDLEKELAAMLEEDDLS